MPSRRLRVGVVGCGLVAQVMHLPHLKELSDHYDLAALCDVSPDVLAHCGERFGVERLHERWEDLIDSSLDGLLVLTSGSHAPVAQAAADAGLHVLVEKPMCFSVAEGRAMLDHADRAGVVLMVGYMKRYDPAYARLRQEVEQLSDLNLVRVTTLESPLAPYLSHHPLVRARPLPAELRSALEEDDASRVRAAIGDADPLTARAYRWVLLDSLVHEYNAVRGVLGEPDRLDFADIREGGVTTVMSFGSAQCVVAWADLPGIARYEMELAFYGPNRRVTLAFPSPFLRSMPTLLTVEGGEPGSARSWSTVETTSYEEAFKAELVHFHDCVTRERRPETDGRDGLGDVALCEAVAACHRDRLPREHPSQPTLITA
jgi:predicted dehydrogenase